MDVFFAGRSGDCDVRPGARLVLRRGEIRNAAGGRVVPTDSAAVAGDPQHFLVVITVGVIDPPKRVRVGRRPVVERDLPLGPASEHDPVVAGRIHRVRARNGVVKRDVDRRVDFGPVGFEVDCRVGPSPGSGPGFGVSIGVGIDFLVGIDVGLGIGFGVDASVIHARRSGIGFGVGSGRGIVGIALAARSGHSPAIAFASVRNRGGGGIARRRGTGSVGTPSVGSLRIEFPGRVVLR